MAELNKDKTTEIDQDKITEIGNPAKPQGNEGKMMLNRMNNEHYDLTTWALSFFDFNESDLILDIGCGGGRTLNRMAEYIRTGHLTGVDYSATSVEMSKEMNSSLIKIGKLDVISASVESLPFCDDSFDKIITVESFYFWPNPSENLREVFRVLKPGGKFLLVAEIYDTDVLSDKQKECIIKYNLFNPTLSDFDFLLRDAGFSDVKVFTKEDTTWICAKGRK